MDDITTVKGLSSTVCFAGVVVLVESLSLALLVDFLRGRISAFEPRESARHLDKKRWAGVDGLFESLLAEAFQRVGTLRN